MIEKKNYSKMNDMSSNSDFPFLSRKNIGDNVSLDDLKKYYEYLIAIGSDFANVSSEMMGHPDVVNLFLKYVNERLCEKITVDGCAIMLVNGIDNTISVRSWYGLIVPPFKLPEYIEHEEEKVASYFRGENFSLDEDTIFSAIIKKAEPLLVQSADGDSRITQNGDDYFLKCGSYIFVPLKQNDDVFGLVLMSRNAGKTSFSENEFEFVSDVVNASLPSLGALSRFLGYKENSGAVKEKEMAISVQKTLFPKAFPEIKDVSLGVAHSSGSMTWGDYYEVIEQSQNKTHFLMMDVLGKGTSSIFILLIVRAVLRMALNFVDDAASFLTYASKVLVAENVTDNHFASVTIISYDNVLRMAEIATAGVNSVFYFDAATQKVSGLSKTSDPLGMTSNVKYSNLKVKCHPGDVMVICTDGLLESINENGEQYPIGKLAGVLKKNADLSGKEIADKIKKDVGKFCGQEKSHDDQTVMVIKV